MRPRRDETHVLYRRIPVLRRRGAVQRVARLAADKNTGRNPEDHRNGIEYSRDQGSYVLDGVVVQDVARGLRAVGEVARRAEENAEQGRRAKGEARRLREPGRCPLF